MIAQAPGETRVTPIGGPTDETPLAPITALSASLSDARWRQLTGLEQNWDGYCARPIDGRAIAAAARLVGVLSSSGFPQPEIFPVADGGVQLEWCIGTMELEIEIEPGAASGVFVGDDAATGRHFDGEFPRDPALWRQALAALASNLG